MRGFVTQRLTVGTGKGILGFVIGHLLRREGVGFVAGLGLLVKGVVLDKRLDIFLFQVGVVFLTAIGAVGNGVLRLFPPRCCFVSSMCGIRQPGSPGR